MFWHVSGLNFWSHAHQWYRCSAPLKTFTLVLLCGKRFFLRFIDSEVTLTTALCNPIFLAEIKRELWIPLIFERCTNSANLKVDQTCVMSGRAIFFLPGSFREVICFNFSFSSGLTRTLRQWCQDCFGLFYSSPLSWWWTKQKGGGGDEDEGAQ